MQMMRWRSVAPLLPGDWLGVVADVDNKQDACTHVRMYACRCAPRSDLAVNQVQQDIVGG